MGIQAVIRRLAIWALLLAGILSFGSSQAYWQSRSQVSTAGFSSSCSQSTSFIARTSGLTNGQKTDYDTLICGLETDGIGCSNTLDALYILGAPDATTSLLNLCGASFALVTHGTIPFVADRGYTGDGSTGYIDTQFIPSSASGFYVQDSAHVSCYDRTSRTSGSNTYLIGSANGAFTSVTAILPVSGGTNLAFGYINNGSAGSSLATTNAQGMWLVSRTGALAAAFYQNGSAVSTTAFGNSTGLPDSSILISALNFGGGPFGGTFLSDQVFACAIGKGLSPTGAANETTRVNTYATSKGANVF